MDLSSILARAAESLVDTAAAATVAVSVAATVGPPPPAAAPAPALAARRCQLDERVAQVALVDMGGEERVRV